MRVVAVPVILLAGSVMIGSSIVASAATPPEQFGGADEIATAASVGLLAGSGNAAVVASLSDAVAGARLARVLQGPLLFTSGDELSPSTAAVLRSTNRRAFVVGGTDTIGASVVRELEEMAGGGTRITRIAGVDRWATMALVEQRATLSTGGENGVVIVIGDDADGAAAVQLDRPLAMVEGRLEVPDSTIQYLRSRHIAELVIVGGTDRVPASVAIQLELHAGVMPRRVAGTDRYQTALAALDEIHRTRSAGHVAYLAAGALPHDGLIAAAAGGVPNLSGPVILSPAGCDPDFVRTSLAQLQPTRLILVSTPPWEVGAGEC